MNKELEEAIKKLKNIVNECKTEIKKIGYECDLYDGDEPIPYKELETVLQALENSISKEVIEKKLQKLDKEEKEAQDSISNEEREEYSDSSIAYLLANIETRREVLKELLEGK